MVALDIAKDGHDVLIERLFRQGGNAPEWPTLPKTTGAC
jgi:hypothetical protein